jgi:hypothetical protein
MCVPPGAFGGTTPERKASELLAAMMTHIACWIVIDQTETTAPRISVRADGARGSDDDASSTSSEGARAARRVTSAHDFLLDFLHRNPVRDADAFVTALVAENPEVARRVLEVRVAYAEGDFEWDNARKLALEGMRASNAAAQSAFLAQTLAASADAADPGLDDDAPPPPRDEKKEIDARDDETKEVTAARRRTLAALRSDWARTRGRTRAFLGVFDGASPPLADRATWVMKSLAGFVEYGDAEDMESERRSLAKLGGTLRGAGVEAGEVRRTVGERLAEAMRDELVDAGGESAWDDDASERWAWAARVFVDAVEEGLAKDRGE